MTQNQLITLLSLVLLVVVAGSVFVLMQSSPPEEQLETTEDSEAPVDNSFDIRVLQQQAYQLLNKQLIREGALPVKPSATVGKANPFL